METFEIAFSGQISPGTDLEQARQGVQRLFNASEQLMQQLFSGRRVIIKQEVDQATALKYQQAFTAVGAVLELRKIETATPAAPEPSQPPQPEPQQAAPSEPAAPATSAEDVVPRDLYMAAFSHVQAPGFVIAPAGTDLADESQQQSAPEIDISSISLAPAGSDMGHQAPTEDVQVPDISHIKLAN